MLQRKITEENFFFMFTTEEANVRLISYTGE